MPPAALLFESRHAAVCRPAGVSVSHRSNRGPPVAAASVHSSLISPRTAIARSWRKVPALRSPPSRSLTARGPVASLSRIPRFERVQGCRTLRHRGISEPLAPPLSALPSAAPQPDGSHSATRSSRSSMPGGSIERRVAAGGARYSLEIHRANSRVSGGSSGPSARTRARIGLSPTIESRATVREPRRVPAGRARIQPAPPRRARLVRVGRVPRSRTFEMRPARRPPPPPKAAPAGRP